MEAQGGKEETKDCSNAIIQYSSAHEYLISNHSEVAFDQMSKLQNVPGRLGSHNPNGNPSKAAV